MQVENMRTLHYLIGNWKAQARVEEVGDGRLMGVITVADDAGDGNESKHTVVFECPAERDKLEEMKRVVRQLLASKYGN